MVWAVNGIQDWLMGLYATCLSNGPPVLRDATADSTLVAELQERIEEKRETITVVPGEGNVLGVWGYNGNIYAFRNKTGAATAGMYKATASGWEEIDLGTALNFDGTTLNGEMVLGAVLTGAGGATGTIAAVSYHGNWDIGAEGTVVLTDVTGTYVYNEVLTVPTISFDAGDVEILEGDVVQGLTSGVTATVKKIQLASGAWSTDDAAGDLSVIDNTGTWTDGEEIHVLGAKRAVVNGASQPSGKTIANAYGTQYAQTLQPNGTYDFVNFNFQGATGIETMYGANGVDNAFEFDGTNFAKIRTGTDSDIPNYVEAYKNHLFLSFANGTIMNSGLQLPTVFSSTM